MGKKMVKCALQRKGFHSRKWTFGAWQRKTVSRVWRIWESGAEIAQDICRKRLLAAKTRVEIRGEVDQKERSQMMRPGVAKPDPKEFIHIPVFRLRVLTATGKRVQVLFKGEPPGDADTGEQVIVKGVYKGVVTHARSIYNVTANSWVTKHPGLLGRLFGV